MVNLGVYNPMAHIIGNNGHNFLIGGDGHDLIQGSGGDDVLYGLSGTDTLDGGNGADYLYGGSGLDFADYFWSSAVFVNLKTNTGAGGQAYGDTYFSIEGVLGSGQGDLLIGDDNGNTFEGRGGADVIEGGGGTDVIYGGEGDDNLHGGEANDEILGGSGADYIDGGVGFDRVDYSRSSAGVYVDLVAGTGSGGEAQGDTLRNVERVHGTSFNDTIAGDAGNNEIYGGYGGFDLILGGGGNDRLSGRGLVNGGTGNDTVFAGDLASTLNGDAGADYLRGGIFNDTISGSNGADTLSGGSRADRLSGGLGADVFSYLFAEESTAGATQDQIVDFNRSEGDRIDLTLIYDDEAEDEVSAPLDFIGTSAFSGTAGELRYANNAVQGVSFIQADINGDRVGDFQVRFTGVITFTAADFIL